MKYQGLWMVAPLVAGAAMTLNAAPPSRGELAAEIKQASEAFSARRSRQEAGAVPAAAEADPAAQAVTFDRAVTLYREQPDDDAALIGLTYVLQYCRRLSADSARCERALPAANKIVLDHWTETQQFLSLASNDLELMDAAFDKGGRNRMLIGEIAGGQWAGRFLDGESSLAERQHAYDMVMKYGTAMAADATAANIKDREVFMVRWKGQGLINSVQNMIPGKRMPDFGFTALDEKPVSLAEYRGKVLLVDFWATWCVPCVASMPAIKQFREEMRAAGKAFEVISVDVGDTPQKVMEFQKTSVDMPWINWHQETFTEEYFRIGLQALPTYFVLDRDGAILARASHFDEALKTRIRQAMAPAATPGFERVK